MISLAAAQAILKQCLDAHRPVIRTLSIEEAVGYVCARDIHAQREHPAFDYSAMDGFALDVRDVLPNVSAERPSVLTVVGEVAAGRSHERPWAPATCVRIMTGAPLPAGANAVVPWEQASVADSRITLQRPVDQGQHIRRAGEDFKLRERLVTQGSVFNPLHAGVLATAGVHEVEIYVKPTVGFLTVGDELQDRNAQGPMIINSNRHFIAQSLAYAGYASDCVPAPADHPDRIRTALVAMLEQSDMVITTGGLSEGTYDYLPKVLNEISADVLIRKVSIKPGKPFTFSKWKGKYIFSLPGNPGAVVALLYTLVIPFLNGMARRNGNLRQVSVHLETAYANRHDRDEILFVLPERRREEWFLAQLPQLNSGSVGLLASARGWWQVPAQTIFACGDQVTVTLFPWNIHS